MTLPYPPPFQDIATLSAHICVPESTIETWVRLGKFPPPKKVNDGKRLWQWKEVERHLAKKGNGDAASTADEFERIRNAARQTARR